jgi:hypothetical protein
MPEETSAAAAAAAADAGGGGGGGRAQKHAVVPFFEMTLSNQRAAVLRVFNRVHAYVALSVRVGTTAPTLRLSLSQEYHERTYYYFSYVPTAAERATLPSTAFVSTFWDFEKLRDIGDDSGQRLFAVRPLAKHSRRRAAATLIAASAASPSSSPSSSDASSSSPPPSSPLASAPAADAAPDTSSAMACDDDDDTNAPVVAAPVADAAPPEEETSSSSPPPANTDNERPDVDASSAAAEDAAVAAVAEEATTTIPEEPRSIASLIAVAEALVRDATQSVAALPSLAPRMPKKRAVSDVDTPSPHHAAKKSKSVVVAMRPPSSRTPPQKKKAAPPKKVAPPPPPPQKKSPPKKSPATKGRAPAKKVSKKSSSSSSAAATAAAATNESTSELEAHANDDVTWRPTLSDDFMSVHFDPFGYDTDTAVVDSAQPAVASYARVVFDDDDDDSVTGLFPPMSPTPEEAVDPMERASRELSRYALMRELVPLHCSSNSNSSSNSSSSSGNSGDDTDIESPSPTSMHSAVAGLMMLPMAPLYSDLQSYMGISGGGGVDASDAFGATLWT